MTRAVNVITGSTQHFSAFTNNVSKHELWYLSPPTVHISALVTGGLKNIYENIRRCLNNKQLLNKEPEHSHQRGMLT
ncbi:hypothetical protein CHUAL_013449 [Chamberlinius hualienensis]